MTDYPLPNVSTDLSGQVALVIGTTSARGRRFAQVIATCGAKVALTGRRSIIAVMATSKESVAVGHPS